MQKTVLRSFILLLSAPLLNSILFGIASLFHEMYYSKISDQQHQDYQTSIPIMLVVLALSILVIEMLFHYRRLTNKSAIWLYVASFVLIGTLTWNQFSIRPYEHGLSFVSIILILPIRLSLEKLWPKLHL